jgi:predicted transcriptional regulator
MGIPESEPAPIFEPPDEAAEEHALAEAEAQVEAGQFISHEAMVKWLRSWGTPSELPPPKLGE